MVLGGLFTVLALAMFAAGLQRHHRSQRALQEGSYEPLPMRWVELFTAAGIGLALLALALILF